MKLTVIGGGSVRTPAMINDLIRRHKEIPIKLLAVHDVSFERIEVIGSIVRYLADKQGAPFKVEFTTDLVQAVRDADFIYTAIRVGGEEGRTIDERVPLSYGVLGQETTGPGGFAMALRTIPVMLEYARVIETYAPSSWVVNFTNPAGLITEALTKYTGLKIIGICDAPSAMKLDIAKYLNEPADSIHINYAGLNHLGWISEVRVNGKDRLPDIVNDYERFAEVCPHMASFSPSLIKRLNMLPNEYLYYFYYREQAVENILGSKQTRGEQILQINSALIARLKEMLAKDDIEQVMHAYTVAMMERQNSYMSAETGSKPHSGAHPDKDMFENEGYAGLAMSILAAIINNRKTNLILNVKNKGIIDFLQEDDIVEVPCVLDGNGPTPLAVGEMPEHVKGLVQSVKQYERYTVSAAVSGSYDDAIMALTVHPLVGSHSLAKKIVDDYLERHKPYLPQFH
ncbi:6-phospho-beta-glucosidase [Paenibacillus alkalitolerans]|uniref:6-phospho-beta-glucosidase n=1 Tax=Paenibacillus alkalitolerans TaxID=2799335 RepID=UPI0018F71F5D|nr:6-phospho-beta-glucosidase [Paenibacillus alkalitolerans]